MTSPETAVPARPATLSWGSLLVAWVALYLAFVAPIFRFGEWTAYLALCLIILPLGLTALARSAWSGGSAAQVGLALLAWVTLSAAVSSSPWLALKGAARRDYSALAVAIAVACWAVGTHLSPRTVRRFGVTVSSVMAASVVVGALQVALDVRTGAFATFSGRASGFAHNPVYYGSLSAGVVGYASARVAGVGVHRLWLAASGAAMCGVLLSGSRVALIAALGVAALAVHRADGRPVRTAIAGVNLIGALVGASFGALFGARSSTARLSDSSTAGRWDVWRYALDGLWDRPIVGTGPGLFREAVQDRFSLQFAQRGAGAGIQPWGDPHNIVVLVTVSTGIVGLVLGGGFLVLALRRSSGPMAFLFVGISVSWLLQPTPLATMPIAMLALGAAAADRRSSDADHAEAPGLSRRAPVVLVGIGLLAACYVAAVDLVYERARSDGDAAAMEDVGPWWLGDPVVWGEIAEAHSIEAGDDESAIRAARRASELEPTRPVRWTDLASYEARAGQFDAARRHLEQALRLEPTNFVAWLDLISVADALGDERLRERAQAMVCDLIESCER